MSPEDAPIKRFGSLYVLEGDLFGSIAIHRDNVIIDGAGYALRGNGEGTGIELYGRTNVTIRNLQITGFEKAISAQQVSNSTFCCNALEGNTMGLWFIGCGDNKIIFNMIRNNREGICLFYNSDGNIVTMNSIFGDSVLPWMSINNIIDMNYWSTYNGTDYDGDGIGDQPHVFFTANSITFLDWHPLMKSRVPWELPYSLADSWNGPLSSPVTILSPINGTCYRISQIPLVVAFKACVGGNLQYSIFYSLDGDRNVALAVIQCPRDPYSLTAVIIGISALWNITEGTHELATFTECYRTDVAQTIGTSLQRVRFTVETKHTDSLEIQHESNEEPRQTMPSILILIAVIAAAFAIILFISRIRVQQHSER